MEEIVFVDQNGRPTGEIGEKLASHTATTRLHLGFSCYVFNSKGELLVTRRALTKKVWPGVWTNTVCGHPKPGEPLPEAINRRLAYELGLKATDIQVALPEYRYKTPLFKGVIENEFCPVHLAFTDAEPELHHEEEVAEWRWMKWSEFVREAEADTNNSWSWWCKDQLKQLKDHPLLHAYLNRP